MLCLAFPLHQGPAESSLPAEAIGGRGSGAAEVLENWDTA